MGLTKEMWAKFKKEQPQWLIERNKKLSIKATNRKISEETREKHRIRMLKHPIKYWLGKHHTEEYKENMKKVQTGRKVTWGDKISASQKGVPKNYSLDVEIKRREKIGKANEGDKCYFWKGGISFSPYGNEFNKILKEQIRRRDNWTCQFCGFIQNGHKLCVHHIDYNKKNNNTNNLITLCKNCHIKTNVYREWWIGYFLTVR